MVKLDFTKLNGLIPAVIQECTTNEILMVAFMNKEAWEKTLATGKVHFFSRTRKKLWLKGETSGNFQLVKEILIGCELDSVLLKVEQVGKSACHKGYKSCFFRKLENNKLKVITEKISVSKKMFTK